MALRTNTAVIAIKAAAMQDRVKVGMDSLAVSSPELWLGRSDIKRSSPARLRCNTLRLDHVLARIHVEEWVDRRNRPFGNGDPMPGSPGLDLAQALADERLPQVAAQRDRPESDHRMPPIAGLCACEGCAGRAPRPMQSLNQILRQEWAV